jgi:hypothetical protein
MDLFNLQNVFSLSKEPEQQDFNTWIQQNDVIPFLQQEIEDKHIIIYASLPLVFIHAVLIPDTNLDDSIIKDLLIPFWLPDASILW